MLEYKICSRCVMDNSDPFITFDDKGFCNYCRDAEVLLKKRWFPNEIGREMLEKVLTEIKISSKNKKYDCILGLSGGVDSSYLLYLATKKWGLRVLAVHVNAGWNTEIAESNIEKLVNLLGVDLYTYVVDWEEVKDLQLSYLKSGLVNIDVPQDHVFFAQLYKKALKEKIKYVFTGHNLATESITSNSFGYSAMDSRQLKFIQKKFGTLKLKSYTTLSLTKKIYISLFKQRIVKPLDFIYYNKEEAKKFLNETFGWQDYGVKHGESVFTRFFQSYWLPEKHGIDKRRSHLSSLIITGLINRDMAIEELKAPLYDSNTLRLDLEYICNKLEISQKELQNYLNMSRVSHKKYPSFEKNYNLILKIRDFFKY